MRGERRTVREEYGPARQGATELEEGGEGITDEGGARDGGSIMEEGKGGSKKSRTE